MLFNFTLFERLLHRLHILPTPIMDAFGGILFGRALTIAVRRGFFETVSERPQSIQQIADTTHVSVQGVQLLADAFVVSGYLKRAKKEYVISEEGKKWLVRSSPQYLGNLIHYFETLNTRWATLEYSLEHGHPERMYFDLFTEEDWKIYVYGMRDLARLLLHEVKSKLMLPKNPRSLLDVGGSHGLYAFECCRKYPSLHATIMDFEPALRFSTQIAVEEQMSGNVSVLAGDFTKADLPDNQDGILMFNIIHGLSEEENRKLIAKAFGSIRVGGKLFILDQMQESRSHSGLAQFMPLMVGLNLLNETGGTSYSANLAKEWCKDFSSLRIHRLRLPGVTLIEAVK